MPTIGARPHDSPITPPLLVLLVAATLGCASSDPLLPAPLILAPTAQTSDVEELWIQGSLNHYLDTPVFVVRRKGARVEGAVLEYIWVSDTMTDHPPVALAGTRLARQGQHVARYLGCTQWEKGRLDSTATYFCRLSRRPDSPSWAEVFRRLDSLAALPTPPQPPPTWRDSLPLSDQRRTQGVMMCSGDPHWQLMAVRNGKVTRRQTFQYDILCTRQEAPYGAYNRAGTDILGWLWDQIQGTREQS